MIELKRNFKKSYSLEFNKQGLNDMVAYLKNLRDHDNLNIVYNNSIREFHIIHNEISENIEVFPEGIKLYMDKEEIEYLLFRLEACKLTNVFFPSELCEKNMGKQEVAIYGIYIQ